jgi:malonate transporter
MLYRFGATTPIAQLLDAARVFHLVAVCAGDGGLHRGDQPERPHRLERRAFGALVAAFPNTGFMGVPLLVALLGPRAAGPASS